MWKYCANNTFLCSFLKLPGRQLSAQIDTMVRVKVEQGELQGAVCSLPGGGSFLSFKGIPYAQPPIGNLRFKAPIPPKNWDGVKYATQHGNVCPQFDIITTTNITGSEDCLYLNVYIPNTNKIQPYPVMVWIHGGGFMSGSGNSDIYGPEHLISEDVIVVTFNYRVEVLGFLCLENEEVPGNAGIKDQVAALKWIQRNISQFGGNPDNITLFGESAGSASVSYHLVSQMSKGLFHKVILQSGIFLCDWAYGLDAKERAFRLGEYLGKHTRDENELLDFLQNISPNKLLKANFVTRTADEKRRGLPLHFCPVIENSLSKDPFLAIDPLSLLLSKSHVEVPMIIGYNSLEGIGTMRDCLKKMSVDNNYYESLVPREVAKIMTEQERFMIAEKIKQHYFTNIKDTDVLHHSLAQVLSDIHFTFNIQRFANIYTQKSEKAMYFYIFSCESDLNIPKFASGFGHLKGSCHADDLFYLFSQNNTEEQLKDPRTRRMVDNIVKLWTTFAKTGNPNPDINNNVTWKPYDGKNKHFMELSENLLPGTHPDSESFKLWNDLYAEVGLITGTYLKSNL